MFWLRVKTDIGENEQDLVMRYSKALLDGRNEKKIAAIDNWCRNNLDLSFENVVCAQPSRLIALCQILDQLPVRSREALNAYSEYLTETLYHTMDRPKKCAKKILLEALDVSVCPYCNRNFVYNIVDKQSGNLVATCELDHFFPKSEYPILAVSFYNLIPSCHFCNHTKNIQELKAFYPHMVTPDMTEQVQFTYWPRKPDYLTNKNSVRVMFFCSVDTDAGNSPWKGWTKNNIENDIEILKLRLLYNRHNDVVQKLLLKYTVWDDSYVEAIYENFKEYFSSKREVIDLFFDFPDELSEAIDTPLGKLKRDIMSELGII